LVRASSPVSSKLELDLRLAKAKRVEYAAVQR
jgi:hypothetical protein